MLKQCFTRVGDAARLFATDFPLSHAPRRMTSQRGAAREIETGSHVQLLPCRFWGVICRGGQSVDPHFSACVPNNMKRQKFSVFVRLAEVYTRRRRGPPAPQSLNCCQANCRGVKSKFQCPVDPPFGTRVLKCQNFHFCPVWSNLEGGFQPQRHPLRRCCQANCRPVDSNLWTSRAPGRSAPGYRRT